MQKSQPFWVWYIPSMLGGCSFFRLIFPADFSISPLLVGEIPSMSPENCSRWLRNLLIKTYWSCFLGNVRARFLAQIVAQTCHVYWCSLLKVPFFVGLNIPHKSFSLKHHFTSLSFPADPLPGNHYYYLPIFVGWPGWPPPTGCHSWVKSSTSEASVAPCWGRWPFKDGCRRHALLPYRRYRVMWKIWWGKSQRSWWVPSGKLT